MTDNVEYRFNIATIGAMKLKSALFVDIGNIWAKTFKDGVLVPEAQFNLSRLYRDLAVGVVEAAGKGDERQVDGIIYASMEHHNFTPPPQLWKTSGGSPDWMTVVILVLKASFSRTVISMVTFGCSAI